MTSSSILTTFPSTNSMFGKYSTDSALNVHFLCIGVQEVLFESGQQRFFFCSSFLRSWCLLCCVFPFLKKEGTQMGNPCTWTQMKQLLSSLADVPEQVPEDIQLMRGP